MEVNFVNGSSVNHYINFGIQTVGYIEAAIVFFMFVMIFIIFTMYLLCELKFIAGLCGRIGEHEEKLLSLETITHEEPTTTKSSLSTDVLKEINEDLTASNNDSEGVESKVLLGVIIKYHANALQ